MPVEKQRATPEVAAVRATPPSAGGFFDRMLSWFRAPAPTPVAAPAPVTPKPASDRPRRESRDGRGGNGSRDGRRNDNQRRDQRNGSESGQRDRSDERKGRKDREPRAAQADGERNDRHDRQDAIRDERREGTAANAPRDDKQRPPREGRRNEGREAKRETPRDGETRDDSRADGRREGGGSGNERRPQTPRPPRVQTPAADASAAGAVPEVNADGTAANAEAGQRREGGRRRRRGRGGQGGAEKGPRVENGAGDSDESTLETGSIAAIPDMVVTPSSFEGHTESIDKIWPEAEPLRTSDAAPPVQHVPQPLRNDFVESTPANPPAPVFAEDSDIATPVQRPEPAAEIRVAAVKPALPVAPPPAVPVKAVPAPQPAAIAPLPPLDLSLPPDSGLELVETRHEAIRVAGEATDAPRPKRVRPPRLNVADEPLEFVETRKDSPSAD
jgi:ribonuclease E